MPRPIIQIYQDGEKYYSVESNTLIEKWNPLYLYEIINSNPVKYIDGKNSLVVISKPSYWFKLVDKEGNLISSDIELAKISRGTIAT
jgi:hypothetical protein